MLPPAPRKQVPCVFILSKIMWEEEGGPKSQAENTLCGGPVAMDTHSEDQQKNLHAEGSCGASSGTQLS